MHDNSLWLYTYNRLGCVQNLILQTDLTKSADLHPIQNNMYFWISIYNWSLLDFIVHQTKYHCDYCNNSWLPGNIN